MKRLLLFISTLLCANVLMAQTTFWIGDIQYEVISTNPAEVEVYDVGYITTVIIPETVSYEGINYSVTSIGECAFEFCGTLTSVTIPNSVTSIGDRAFRYCSSLTSVNIPNSVTSIGVWAFQYCRSLTSIDIPNSVTSIGTSAFNSCSSLTSVNIGNGVTSIGSSAFSDCYNLTSVNIGNGVTSIGSSAFSDCSSLTSIDIPNSVTSIGEYAFDYCSSLTYVTIPNSVTSIGNMAFRHCSSLTSIDIPNSVTYIGSYAFSNCDGLTSVTIGNSVTTIENSAFEDCSSLTSVTIPNSVTSIGNYAFGECSSLTSVTIPNSITSIEAYAFRNCNSLTSVILPNNANISSDAFENTGVIKVGGIYYGGKETVNIGNYTFNNVGFIKFYLNGNATTITPSEVSVIDCDESLSGDIVIPSILNYGGENYSVTSIGDEAFYSCTSLTSVTIPNSVTSIENYAFDACTSLTSVTIPNSVTSIGYSAFAYCRSLTSVTIPNSVTSIGNSAFEYCRSLDSVTCLKETALSLGNLVFYATPSTKVLNIPFGSDYSSWQGATNWSKTNYLIQEGETKELSNDFTINSTTGLINQGVLRITQNGQLINTTSENVSGVYEIETPTLPIDKWSFVGAPFNGYKLEAIKEGTNDVSISLFDYGTGTWSTGWATIEDQVGAGEGYFLWSFAAEPTIFTTDSETQDDHYTLNNDVVTVEKNLTTHQEGGNWMALANPYTFKLDVAEFLEDNTAIKQELQGRCVYCLNEEGAFDPAFDGAINLTEGFFVNFANPEDNTATFNKDQRHIGAKKSIAKKDYLKLTMKDGNKERELYFAQNEEAKQEYDIFDANKLFAPIEITEPYFVTEGNALVKEEVQSLPYTATLNVKSYESKEITFRIDNIPTDINVYLLDNGQDIKMNGGVEYTTNITAGENADRFQILFKKQQKIERAKTNQITIKNYNRHITIQSQITNLNIEVYNSIGQKVLETKSYDFHLDQVPAGSYVVKAYYGRVSQSQKIVIE